MYPSAPTWQSGAALSAWWRSPTGDGSGAMNVCATQGQTFVKMLQEKINSTINHGIWNNPWDATDLHTGNLNLDGNWGSLTTQGLGKLAQNLRLPQEYQDAIEHDYRANAAGVPGNQFSLPTLQAAILVSQNPELDISKISLSANATAPRWNVTPPDDGDASNVVSCWPEGAVPPNPSNPRVPAAGGVVGLNQNPISTQGLTGSTAGGTSTGLLFLLGATAAAAIGVAVLASSKPRIRYRTRRARRTK